MKPWFSIGVAVIAAGVGFWAWQSTQQNQAPDTTSTTGAPPPPAITPEAASDPETLLQQVPALSYVDLEGDTRSLDEWRDKVLVLNFWATWCPPCREETPLFVALQDEYKDRGVQFVGIAIDDPEAVRNFIDTYGVEYPILIGDMAAVDVSRQLGNRFSGLPFTVIAAPGGKVVIRHFGGMKREQVVPILDRLTQAAKAQ